MKASFEDSELKAYLSGSLSPDAAARVEAALEMDDELEARLLAMEPLTQPLRQIFEELPQAARLPELPAEQAALVAGWRRVLPFGIVACAAGLLGFVLPGVFAPERSLTWQEQVAVYQALYVAETVAPLSPTSESLAVEFARASEALGLELDPSDYAELPGLTLKRAQILGFEDTPLIQIAFAADSGAPVAFCILRSNDVADPILTELSGLPTVHWSQDGYGFMVIGDLPIERLEALADRLDTAL